MKAQIITNIILVGIIILLSVVLNRTCNRVCDVGNSTSDTTYVRDTIVHLINEGKDSLITVIKRDTLTLTHTDTINAIGHYFDKNIVQRQFNDTLLQATLFDTITENKAKGSLKYKILRPITIINNNPAPIIQTKNRIYLIGALEYNYQTPHLSALAGLNYVSKNRVSVALLANQKFVQIMGGYKIKLK